VVGLHVLVKSLKILDCYAAIYRDFPTVLSEEVEERCKVGDNG
jgi:hypothetical protein